jgi:hypothetical protein
MATQMDTAKHEIVLIEEAHIRPMIGLGFLEPLPSAGQGMRSPSRKTSPGPESC